MTEQSNAHYLASSAYESLIGLAIHLGRKLIGRSQLPPRTTYHELVFDLKCHEPAGCYRCITCRRDPDSLRGHKRLCIAHHQKALWYRNCDLTVGRPTLYELELLEQRTSRQDVAAGRCQAVTLAKLKEALNRL